MNNDLYTNLEAINRYTEELGIAVDGAKITTKEHERFIKGGIGETIDTDQGPIKTLSGIIDDWIKESDIEVDNKLISFDTSFDGKIVEYDKEFFEYLLTLGFQLPVIYEGGINITERSQTVSYNGVIYFWTGDLPFTTSGVFENDDGFQIAPINNGVSKPTFTFSEGGTLFSPSDSVLGLDGQWYYWEGNYPKIIPNGSTLESAGGLGEQKFKTSGGFINLRPTIVATLEGTGHVLSEATFETGVTLVSNNELLLQTATGLVYKWNGNIPYVVSPFSTPQTSGGISDNKWSLFQPLSKMYKVELFLKEYGYEVVGNFVDGCFIDKIGQMVITKNGDIYIWDGPLPKAVSSNYDYTGEENFKKLELNLSNTYTSETKPVVNYKNMLWYKPSTNQTFIFYIGPNGVGAWIQQ